MRRFARHIGARKPHRDSNVGALKRRGIEKPPWLTPMEFARVLPEPDLSILVEEFTAAYNALRFGGNPDDAGRIVRILVELESR